MQSPWDIVQDTLVTAHEDLQSFGGNSEEELRLWLRRMLLNKLANARRKFVQNEKRNINREVRLADKAQDLVATSFVDPNPTPTSRALNTELAHAVRATIERLPDRDKQLIRLRTFELKPFAEVGQLMDMSADSARKAWCRAIVRFRDEWQAPQAINRPDPKRRQSGAPSLCLLRRRFCVRRQFSDGNLSDDCSLGRQCDTSCSTWCQFPDRKRRGISLVARPLMNFAEE